MLHATRIDRPAHERMRVAAPTQAVPPQRERRHVATPLRPSQAPLAQRKCACGGLGGECASCRRERLQTCRQKLGGQPARSWAISPAQDAYEQEADRVAEQVLAMDPQKTADVPGSAVPHKTEGVTPALRAPAAVREVLQSEGQPLAPEARAFLEPRFGNDFGHVRVHTGSRAAESARQINALAYTVSNHVVFGAGRYEPGTSTGRRLLAHELTHVLQQEAGTRATHAQKAEDPTAEGGEYGVDDAIARLELALSTADAALADPTLDPGKRSLIERQVERLTPLLDQLPDARGTEGEDIVFDFDPDLRENEINPGDADRSIAELFAESPEEAPEEVPETDEGSGGPDFLQATAQPGGLRVTPLASPVVQRDGGLTVIIIIALAGLLLAGCKDSSSSSQPTPSQPPPPPTPPPQPPAPPTAAPATPTQADRFT